MKLMTTELEKILNDYPMESQDGKGKDAIAVAVFYNPFGAGIWLITEGEKDEDGNWLLFGYCHICE